MRVAEPRAKSLLNQGTLFDNERKIENLGQARYLIGEYFEEWLEEITDGTRLQTTASADICPDLLLPNGYYAESKGSGCNNQIILYKERCERYDKFIAEGNKVVYVAFNHDVRAAEMKWMSDLRKLRERCKAIVFIDARRLHKYLYQTPTRVVNGSHENEKYHEGWTVGISTVLEISSGESSRQREFLTFRGNKFA